VTVAISPPYDQFSGERTRLARPFRRPMAGFPVNIDELS
jgi:hypothetical protein